MIAFANFTSPAESNLHVIFVDLLLPKIQRHAAISFKYLKCEQKRNDRIAECIGLGWRWYCRLVQRGKDATQFPVVFAYLVVKAVKSGRKVAGQNKAQDVLNELAQQRHRFKVESLPTSMAAAHEQLYGGIRGQQKHDEWEERLADNRRTPPDEQAMFRLDFKAWLQSLTGRERRIIRAMARNERTRDLGRQFDLSQGRISQLRREFQDGWKRFVGDELVCRRRRIRKLKKRVQV